MSEKDEGLILLKCRGCKQPTIFRLWFCHEPDKGWTANTHCASCEKDQPLTRVTVRSLEQNSLRNNESTPLATRQITVSRRILTARRLPEVDR